MRVSEFAKSLSTFVLQSKKMIKKLTAVTSLLIVLLLSSCLDTEEKIVIHKNNSGLYTVTIDMSKMLVMMDQMGQKSEEDSKVPEKKDSTIYFKTLTDTATALSAREKELFQEGSLRMRVDEAAKELVITLNFPFQKISDLAEIRASYLSTIDKLSISRKLKNEEDSTSGEEIPPSISGNKNFLNPSQDAYVFSAAAGKISNTLINKEGFDANVKSDSTMQMLQQMTMMMGDMHYKTIITAPHKIKKYNGNEGVLSADKKTVTFQTTLNDVLNRPEAAEYSVEY